MDLGKKDAFGGIGQSYAWGTMREFARFWGALALFSSLACATSSLHPDERQEHHLCQSLKKTPMLGCFQNSLQAPVRLSVYGTADVRV